MKPQTKSDRVRPIPEDRERFASLLHNIVLRFGAIQEDIRTDNAKLRAEWSAVRGLCSMTEDRLESAEARLERLERLSALVRAVPEQQLRGILANYGPSLDALRVLPDLDSAVGDAR